MNEIKSDLLSQFDLYLKTEKDCEFNGAMKHLKNLKKIIGIALQNNWIKSDPFANYTFQYEKVETTFLTDHELSAILMKTFGCQRLENVRDTFVFCCFTGLAFSDVQQLRPEHIVTDNDGKMWIRKARQKTKQMANIPLLEIPLKIIEKYRENPQCERRGTLLPVLTNQKMNAYLKEIADVCGITKKITSHCARHTFATTVTLGNNVSIESVSKMLGHSDIKMTQHYARILDKTLIREMGKLEGKYSDCMVS